MSKVFGLAKRKKVWTIEEIAKKNNKILIIRATGGLGDILMMRMIFEDFKLINPNIHITFACPIYYHDIVRDHPFIDEVVDSNTINKDDFLISWNLSTACGAYEQAKAPYGDKHRSDIWAEYCGVTLTCHNMHLQLTQEEVEFGKNKIKELSSGKPVVIISPISALIGKNLDKQQIDGTVMGLQTLGFDVFGLHLVAIPDFPAKVIAGLSIRNMMAVVSAADYIVSVDSATFHMAGGLGRPVVGIFSWANGLLYGKWYSKCVIVQKRKKLENWQCPCYDWFKCPLCPDHKVHRKPCITEITSSEIVEATRFLARRFPVVSDI